MLSFSVTPVKPHPSLPGEGVTGIMLPVQRFLLANLARVGREIGSNAMFHSQQGFFYSQEPTL